MIAKAHKYFILLDTNAHLMVSLFKALSAVQGGNLKILGWRIFSLGYLLFNLSQFKNVQTSYAEGSKLFETAILVPGWTRS
jgi:hypothetical protein